jgi:hypothetical protein
MVESMRRQGFACLRGGRRTEKGGFKNRAAAPHKNWFYGQCYALVFIGVWKKPYT